MKCSIRISTSENLTVVDTQHFTSGHADYFHTQVTFYQKISWTNGVEWCRILPCGKKDYKILPIESSENLTFLFFHTVDYVLRKLDYET